MSHYTFKTKPYDHQRKALERSVDCDAFAFLMEMGTGKTKVAIDEIGVLFCEGKIDAAVVVAPKGVYANWTNLEIPTHLGDEVVRRAVIHKWEGLRNKDEKRTADYSLRHPGLSILVINTEAFSSSKKAIEHVRKFLSKRTAAIYVDESTLIKNHSSSRTKNLTMLAKLAKYRRILTGSPVTRSPLDFYAQFNFLKPGLIGPANFYPFRAKYAVLVNKVFGGRKVLVVESYQNLDDLTQRVQQHSFRVLKEDCLDLPPKIFVRREVELTEDQERIYLQMREDAMAELADEAFASATIVMTKIMRLQQIVCGHITDADGNVHQIPHRRVDAMMEVLDEVDGKTIIWAHFRNDIRQIKAAIEKEYGPRSVVDYWGEVDQQTREEAVRRFQNDPECRYFVANQSTGGYGITLTAASNVIYYSNSFDLEKRLQSEDRAHRSGQTKSVTYVDLVTPNTVDDKILEALRSKKNVADLVTGDGYREWM